MQKRPRLIASCIKQALSQSLMSPLHLKKSSELPSPSWSFLLPFLILVIHLVVEPCSPQRFLRRRRHQARSVETEMAVRGERRLKCLLLFLLFFFLIFSCFIAILCKAKWEAEATAEAAPQHQALLLPLQFSRFTPFPTPAFQTHLSDRPSTGPHRLLHLLRSPANLSPSRRRISSLSIGDAAKKGILLQKQPTSNIAG